MTTPLSSSSQAALDPWDQPESSSSNPRAPSKSSTVVRDDWEDDEEEDNGTVEGNQKIWDEANKASNPMPSVVIAPSATSAYKVLSPPPGAFQPQMRILKRPQGTGSQSSTPPPTSPSPGTLQEREAKYQAARERIFGQSSPSPAPPDDKDRKPVKSSGISIVRNPRGPEDDTSSGSIGFQSRTPNPNSTDLQ